MTREILDARKSYLITGAAGFIGFFLAKKLLEKDCSVIGIDSVNDYYDVNLKRSRLDKLEKYEKFVFVRGDIADKEMVFSIFQEYKPDIVINLAAQAGVRYSIENPEPYITSNIIGFFNILEACRHFPVDHLVYASSSSVYGANKKVPFEETDFVDHPVSLYAATKKCDELMAYTYSYLYKVPATGLRFFTVYGPMGRPDMAYFSFTSSYFAGRPVSVFNNGDFNNDLSRDFTYIDDIVECLVRVLVKPPEGDIPNNLYNIGNNKPEKLMFFIETLENSLSKSLGRQVQLEKIFKPINPGDVPATYASTDLLQEAIGYSPKISIVEGLQRFTDWYVDYYGVD